MMELRDTGEHAETQGAHPSFPTCIPSRSMIDMPDALKALVLEGE